MRVIIVDDEIKALQLFLSQIVDINLEYRFFKDDSNAILDFVKKNEISGAFLDSCTQREPSGSCQGI